MEAFSEYPAAEQRPFLSGIFSAQKRTTYARTRRFRKIASTLSRHMRWLNHQDSIVEKIYELQPASLAAWEQLYRFNIQSWEKLQETARWAMKYTDARFDFSEVLTAICIICIDLPWELFAAEATAPFAGTPYSRAARAAFRVTPEFKAMNSAWNESRQNSYKVLKSLSGLFNEHRPATLVEWENIYLTHGHDPAYLDEVAKVFQRYTPSSSFEQAKLAMLIHIFEETFEGMEYEVLSRRMLRTHEKQKDVYFFLLSEAEQNHDAAHLSFLTSVQEQGKEVVFVESDASLDHDYSVDLQGFIGDRLVMAVQIKGLSYFWRSPATEKAKHVDGLKVQKYQQLYPDVPFGFLFSKDILAKQIRFVPSRSVVYNNESHTCMGSYDNCDLMQHATHRAAA